MNLKQRLFKLEQQFKQKETIIEYVRIDIINKKTIKDVLVNSEMKSDPRWTRSTELEIQNRALLSELEKAKFEKLKLTQK